MKRVIVTAVHAKGKYAWLFCEDAGGAIALVYVEVDDEEAFRDAVVEEIIGCHCKIIQQAEAFAPVCKGMVCSAGDVERDTVVEGMAATIDGAFCDHQFPVCEGGGLWESDVPLLFWGECLMEEFGEIFTRMGEEDDFFRAGDRCKEVVRADDAFVQELFRDQFVFQHGEPVAFRERVCIDGIKGDIQLFVGHYWI